MEGLLGRRALMSNQLLVAISLASFAGALFIAWAFDSKLALFLATLLASTGGAIPLSVIARRRNLTS
jgi:hypothetical protein